jgi:F1F0 ATPase subunit 2
MTAFWMTVPICLAVGLGTGLLYFSGLWWTVRRLANSRRPAAWSLASFLLRSIFVLAVFYISTQGRWDRLLACLVGFTAARAWLLRRWRPRKDEKRIFDAPAGGLPTNRKGRP